MIDQSQVIPLILSACPGFQERWLAHRTSWGDEEAGIYNDVSQVAHYLINAAREGDTLCFSQVFGVIERLILEGDEYV